MSASTSPAGNYLLDTNVLVALLRGEAGVGAAVESAAAVYMAELIALGVVLGCDAETALVYGDVKTGLRRRGRPIPENDVWIATAALQHGLVLVTRDAHFDAVEELPREAW